ncbi:hypothetical protein [Streptosporangium sandarakinum]|uniref:hypothetical protein n=1 Tax=Streptosporangium sandarakinum TaxID=1260955 RepID=UPI0036B80ADD
MTAVEDPLAGQEAHARFLRLLSYAMPVVLARVVKETAEWIEADATAKRRILAEHPGSTATDECPGCGGYLDGTWRTGPGAVCSVRAALTVPYGAPGGHLPQM